MNMIDFIFVLIREIRNKWLPLYIDTISQWVYADSALRSEQNGRYLKDDIFKSIFWNMLILISWIFLVGVLWLLLLRNLTRD